MESESEDDGRFNMWFWKMPFWLLMISAFSGFFGLPHQ
ncbi:hypothetical protein SLEP1_g24025 [Rubroshorea leprosula]|uniref:Uncharacterized protein n=1 Tax=Rubroshorea leprosula TaxID=152421 RepID=A0AAV5JHB2_9ROSI|nr:hypothetical protein SLEP1_g24025 [Rubroshorea leprosula]